MTIKSIFVLSAIAALGTFSTQASAADLNDPIVLQAPCAPTAEAAKAGPMAGFKTCDAFFNGEGGRPGFLANLKALLKTKVDKVTQAPTGTGVQMCVLGPNPFIQKDGQPYSEERTNRFGASCGNPMTVSVQTNPIVVQFHKQPPQTGTLEDGWLAGGEIQALAFYHSQVAAEIVNTKKFTVRHYSHGPSYVASMASGYLDVLNTRNAMFNLIAARTDTKDLLAAVSDCKKAEDGTDQSLTFAVGQQAVQLCSAQMSLERFYLNTAVADIMGRAEDSYYNNLRSDAAYAAMLKWIQDTMKMVCRNAGVNGANQCYQNNVASKIRDYIKGVWPLPTAVASAPGSSNTAKAEFATPWFLMAAGLKRRKRLVKSRRRKAGSRANSGSLRRLLRPLSLSFLVALGGVFLTACPSSSVTSATPTQLITGPPSAACPGGDHEFRPECCATDGSLCDAPNKAGCSLPTGEYCSNPHTLLGGETETSIVTGSDDMTATRTSLDNARVLLGIPTEAVGGITTNSLGGVQSAALAGAKLGSHDGVGDLATNSNGTPTQSSLTGTSPDTAGDGAGNANQGSSAPNLFGSGSGGSNVALGGAGGGLGSDTKGDASAAGAGADKAGKGQTYGGGGAKPGSGDTNVDPSSFFGELNGGDRSPANQDAAFGKLDATKAMGTSDPDDYFTRVGLDENIFRIVSRRYRAKAFNWASVQSQASFQEASHATVKK